MIKRTTKLRVRRIFKRHKRHVEEIGTQAEAHLERHLFRRLERLGQVRRFMATWTMFFVVLMVGLVLETKYMGNYYLSLQPEPGGAYTEGILGSFTNANPIYATSAADSSVARLVFSGLLTYNADNRLVGDLAQTWQTDSRGVQYTVHLKSGLVWHDGQPLTSADVVFTYQVIQNADAKSPLFSSWQGISVTAPDPQTVVFTLPSALSSFPYSLTTGIIPKHVLDGVPMTQMRSSAFNSANPIGAGPFKWQAIEVHGDKPLEREERIALVPNENYNGGKPKLEKFIVRCFRNEDTMAKSFSRHELNGVVGFEATPAELKDDKNVHSYNIPLNAEVMVFFKMSNPILGDATVRRALLLATDTNAVIVGLDYPVIPAYEPLLKSSVGFDKKYAQAIINENEANRLLEGAGWAVGSNGIRSKDGKPLSFTIFSQNSSEFTYLTQTLQKQWRAVGVDAQVVLQPSSDLQATISQHSYDALVYGISIGLDPDVFVYWHSSQADVRSATRLNFSEYKSGAADSALDGGRTRSDPALRAIKYAPFLQAWQNDVPAISFYQPRLFYLTNGKLFGLSEHSINTPQDRYNNVINWMIRQKGAPK